VRGVIVAAALAALVAVVPAAAGDTLRATAVDSPAAPSGDNTAPLSVIAIVMMVALIAVASAHIVLGRRRRHRIVSAGPVDPRPAEVLEVTPVAEPEPEPESESESKLESEPDPESASELALEAAADPAAGMALEESPPEPDPEPDQAAAEPVSIDEPNPNRKAKPEPVSAAGPSPKRKSKSKSTAKSRRSPKAESTAEASPSPNPKPAGQPRLNATPEPSTEPEQSPDADPVPTPEPMRARDTAATSGAIARRRRVRPTPSQPSRGGARREPEPGGVGDESNSGPAWLVSGKLRCCPASGEVWSGRRQVQLDPPEVAILALLMIGGDRGVTQDDIIKAGNLDPDGRDVAATLARIRRKTGTKGRGQMVRRERVTLYVFDDDVETGAPQTASRRSTRPHVRR
jgi:hypothetical protein